MSSRLPTKSATINEYPLITIHNQLVMKLTTNHNLTSMGTMSLTSKSLIVRETEGKVLGAVEIT